MMPYKNIDDNLTTREFNGIVSLLRDNVRFNEDIQINTRNVNGAYGEYQFNFHEATMLDNGVLITNQTLTTIGTVKLVNPAFPHSNYYLDLKVYSSEDIGVLDEEDVLVTPLTVKLVKDTEVNIPFETLEMNNIIGFDAVVRINHKDLVIKNLDVITLESEKSSYGYKEPIELVARYTDDVGTPIEGKEIVFRVNDAYLGIATTNSEGIANFTVTYENKGDYKFQANCGSIRSNELDTEVVIGVIEVTYEGINRFDSLATYERLIFSGKLSVDWGDNVIEEYTSFKDMIHNYPATGNYTVKFKGNISKINDYTFNNTHITSAIIPNSVTHIGSISFSGTQITEIELPNVEEIKSSFYNCQSLNKVTLSNTLRKIGDSAFANCTSLESIDIPNSVVQIEDYAFNNSAKYMYLNWTTADSIIPFNSRWNNYGTTEKYYIPAQTKSLYIAKGYPASKLFEPISYDGITLTSDRDILSYNGGTNPDVATLTAQLTSGGEPVAVEGETVTFEVRKQSDDSLVETLSDVTDSSGKATVGYTSKGAGDLYIKAECMFVSKTYGIIDAWKYIPNPTNQTNLDWSIPSKAKISFNMKHIDNGVYLLLQDDSHDYYVGNWSSNLNNGVLIRNIGSSSNLVSQTVANIPSNTEIEVICEYDNGQWKYIANGNIITFSANYTPTKLVMIGISGQSSYMKDLIIKQL